MEEHGDLELVGRLGVGGVSWEEGEHLDYATIAKAGGRRDLLHHFVNIKDDNKLPVIVPVSVDWFAHPTPAQRQTKEYISPLKDHWCQWNTTVPKLPEITNRGKKAKAMTFPPVAQRGDVNFTRLLALDYQREWLYKRQEKQERLKKLAKEKKMAQLKKLQEHSMKKHNEIPPSDSKTRFLMKRFKNIPSKVKLPPI